jgi:hypothetical protein
MASKLVNALTPKDPYVDMPEITYDVTMKSSETEIVEGLNHALLTDPSSDAQTTLLGDFERRLQVLTLAIDQYPMYGNPTDIPTGHTTVMAIKFLGSAATEFGQLIYETMSFSQYLNVPLSTAIVSLLHKSFGYTAAEIHADPTLETAMNTKFLRHLGGVDLMSAKLPITKDTLLRASKESLVQTVHQWLARFQQKAKALSSAKIISLKETLHNAMFSMRSRTTTS